MIAYERQISLRALHQAIALNPTYRDKAKNDTDFDDIRESDAFQALVEGS
ncbi:MAG: hypothetical protein KME15_03735 [Drouetiella hepatica Uher 2000/2452]|jgi:hypothetical protein|uniref:Uncharacterized protein n=1 Tax=Drouetiella hepatica Uher 2000/2452 TaxID=904376 RepID=A0A951Q8E3_9CYAN|nr:hypothetical protein [Drouetiella hepatica Uher 2000/2452]